jgi:hypothetical protein
LPASRRPSRTAVRLPPPHSCPGRRAAPPAAPPPHPRCARRQNPFPAPPSGRPPPRPRRLVGPDRRRCAVCLLRQRPVSLPSRSRHRPPAWPPVPAPFDSPAADFFDPLHPTASFNPSHRSVICITVNSTGVAFL